VAQILWVVTLPDEIQAKPSDSALVFKLGTVTYSIQGDSRLVGEDS
jgi:hypothetical protein